MTRRANSTDLASAWNECKVRTGDGPHWLYMVFMRSVLGWGPCEPRHRRYDDERVIAELEAAKEAEQNEGAVTSDLAIGGTSTGTNLGSDW